MFHNNNKSTVKDIFFFFSNVIEAWWTALHRRYKRLKSMAAWCKGSLLLRTCYRRYRQIRYFGAVTEQLHAAIVQLFIAPSCGSIWPNKHGLISKTACNKKPIPYLQRYWLWIEICSRRWQPMGGKRCIWCNNLSTIGMLQEGSGS